MQDPTKVLMGQINSSIKEISNHSGDPSIFQAGLLCRLKSDDTLSLVSTDGSIVGVSMGRSLADTLRVPIARKGVGVPVQVTSGFTPVKGAQVMFSNSTGKCVTSGGTNTNAYYEEIGLTGVDEDGNVMTDPVAKITFIGGL